MDLLHHQKQDVPYSVDVKMSKINLKPTEAFRKSVHSILMKHDPRLRQKGKTLIMYTVPGTRNRWIDLFVIPYIFRFSGISGVHLNRD